MAEANRFVDREQPWILAKQAREGDTAAATRLSDTLGDLLEACRLVGLTVAPYMPDAARRVHEQLGIEFEYGPDGGGGPPLESLAVWGAVAPGGKVGTSEILFPRVEIEQS